MNYRDYECVRIEDFEASDLGPDQVADGLNDASESFRESLAASGDIYISLMGSDYGPVQERSGKSFAELEYDTAVNFDIPLMAFTVPERFNTLHLVSGDGNELQRAFRERVRNALTSDLRMPGIDFDRILSGLQPNDDLLGVTIDAALRAMKEHLRHIHEFREWGRKEAVDKALRGKTWLLFQYVNNGHGFDTGISIANVSLDPIGLTTPAYG